LSLFRPADPALRPNPFDDRFIFELKHDGFRAVAYVSLGACQLLSRHWNAYKSFKTLGESPATLERSAVLDGEIVLLDATGGRLFYELVRRRGEPVFYAFACLSLDGRDLRPLPLIERKQMLERLVTGTPYSGPAN